MSVQHEFGGHWTEQKLATVAKYLQAYTRIFHTNPRARHLTTWYVDAFAGCGTRAPPSRPPSGSNLLVRSPEDIESTVVDEKRYREGSAEKALKVNPRFDHYLFIEKRAGFAKELKRLYEGVDVRKGDANEILLAFCRQRNWVRERAVVFLDPYGMAVEWRTIEAIAATQAIDLWVLVPLAQAVNRLLTTKKYPNDSFSRRLTAFFGTDSWRGAFYSTEIQEGLFGPMKRTRKEADWDAITKFFVDRLGAIFPFVSKKPRALYNTRNLPLFLLCFAAGNARGGPTAVKIADSLMKP